MNNLAAFQKFEEEFWQKTAKSYDDGFGNITSQTAQFLLDAAGVKTGTPMLDVACGPGYIAGEALKRGAKATGIDFSAAMIVLAKQKIPGAIFQTADAQKLPFKENSFDAITCNFGIMHLPEPEKAFAEAFRTIKYGGTFAFVVWNNPSIPGALNIIMSAIKEHGTMDVPLPEGPPFFQYSDSKTAIAALKTTGFINTHSKEIGIHWNVASPDDMIGAFYNGGARIGGILRAQTAKALKKIKNAVTDSLQPHFKDGIYAVPVSVVLSSGTKP
jgi:ubiquinone/menaquinone biosynthesis C-methylase UbiE